MAAVTVTAVNTGRTKTAIAERAERTAEMTAMYGALGKAIKGVADVAAVEDQASAFLVVKTRHAGIEIQVSHPKEIQNLSEGDLDEWAILWGNFDEANQDEEYLPGNTTAAAVAKRVDALLRELNAKDAEAPVKPKRTITRKAEATPEPVVEEKPKRAITRKAKVEAEPVVEEAPKRGKIRALPTRAKK